MNTADAYVEAWIADLCSAWMEQDLTAALSLFAKCKNYRETPFSENAAACRTGIEALWHEVLAQSDIAISARLRVLADDKACVEYHASYTYAEQPRTSSGIWVVAFEDGACVTFEQWSVSCDARQ
jgi:hypothetical protein